MSSSNLVSHSLGGQSGPDSDPVADGRPRPRFRVAENQFRALDEEEISFLDSLVDDDNEEEVKKQQEIKDQLAAFKA